MPCLRARRREARYGAGVKARGAGPLAELDVTIDELAPGGDGVAIAVMGGERRAIFVRRVARGDRVRLAIDARTRPARGRVLTLLEPSPDRVVPACAWADRCGGCDWMHVSAGGQRHAHVEHVRAALPPAWRGHPVSMHAMPSPLGYRTRARVHARASGGRAIVGMNEVRTRDPVEVDSCAVLHPDLDAARGRLAALLDGAHGRGDAQIALGAHGPGARPAVLDLRWSGALPAACFARLGRAVEDGWLAGARVTAGEARVPAKVGDPTPWILAGDGDPLRLAAGGFGQASDEGNVALSRRVLECAQGACDAKADARVLELYAGAGNFTVLLAAQPSTRVLSVESDREGCDAARANLEARGLAARAKVVEGDAAGFEVPAGTHLVVLDPPRTGAREACARIAASSARHVVYVSCDTQTLARDLALLAAGGTFAPRSIDAFELFPQTSHAETVVHLERSRR
jgi:23S rRNA (uracil1939-C5)-methyltransferase